MVAQSGVDDSIISMIRKLLYPRGKAQCLSDFELVLRHVPSEADRLRVVKALSRQTAVLARIRIRPDTDIDKLLGYWAAPSGIRFKDVRPLLESLTRLQNGGSISLLYLLPAFARERLYTFPLPPKPGDPKMDCHWMYTEFLQRNPGRPLWKSHLCGPIRQHQFLSSGQTHCLRRYHFPSR